jgi:hypothetical protein
METKKEHGMSKVYRIDFRKDAVASSELFKYVRDSANYLNMYSWDDCWIFESDKSWLKLSLTLTADEIAQEFIALEIILRRPIETSDKCYSKTTVCVNDKSAPAFEVCYKEFSNYYICLPAAGFKKGDNTIKLQYDAQDTQPMYMGAIQVTIADPVLHKDWMCHINDGTSLSSISIPGTHDSAAINTWMATFYSCQDRSITKQLEGGIRLLDIRLKTKKNAVVTCHGDISLGMRVNEFQTFKSVLEECTQFLKNYKKEAIIMSLKVDDWGDYGKSRDDGKKLIAKVLAKYSGYLIKGSSLPTLGKARGKIVLLNRIGGTLDFGMPLSIPDNTAGEYLGSESNRSVKVFVQDKYEMLYGGRIAALDKLKLVCDAIVKRWTEKNWDEIYINFASANYMMAGLPLGIYIHKRLAQWLGEKETKDDSGKARPTKMGWILMDYPFWEFNTAPYNFLCLPDLIIDANFNYESYSSQFLLVYSE